MTPGPADEARRALREARERAAQDHPPAPAAPAEPSPAGEAAGQETPSARAGTEPRAADVAREALRAARDDARRAREETERGGARRRRRARQRHVDDRAAAARRAAADAPGSGTPDLRQFLSDAFRMPAPQESASDEHLGSGELDGLDGPGPEVADRGYAWDGPGPEMTGRGHGLTAPGREAQNRAESPSPRPEPSDAPTETGAQTLRDLDRVAHTHGPAPRDPGPITHTGAPAPRDSGLAADSDDRGPRGSGSVSAVQGEARVPGDRGSVGHADGPVLRDSGLAAGSDDRGPRGSGSVSAVQGEARVPGDRGSVGHADGPVLRDSGLAAGSDDRGPRGSGSVSAVQGEARVPGDRGSVGHADGPVLRDSGSTDAGGASASRGSNPAAATDAPAPSAPAPGYAPPLHPAPPLSVTAGPMPVSATSPTTSASRTPRSARSMAAPARDHELRRTFAPFPPRDGDRFAESWWGNAWVGALEQGALDVKRLERGRGYAGQGHVDAITVTPGLVLAYVQGSRPRPYRVQVRLRTLDDTDWDRFLDAAADRPGHIAALLDKEMPQSLAESGVPLLPGPGDLEPRCSCPDRGHPCKHAAALCYQTARLLDADPFVLLLLRGRGERELLDALSRLSATRSARAARDKGPAPLPGVRAAEVLASRALPPLPAPLPPPAHPEQPPAYPAAPGGPDPFALDQLATDAAARAHALLGTGRDPVGQLTFWQDAVRLAAARPGAGLTAGTRALYSSLASAAGRTPSELARAVAAWRQGGLEGLAVLEEPWDPPAGRFDRARPLLLAADLPAFRPWRNHLTHPRGHLQLRLGRDGLWYAYESEPGHDDWWPRGTPDLDPVGALTGLGLPSDF